MKTFGHGLTNIGKMRERNEDVMLVDDDLQLYIVCDGIGGRQHGDLAATTAGHAIAERLRAQRELIVRAREGDEPESAVAQAAEEAVLAGCREVNKLSSAHGGASMGCTMTLVVVLGHKGVMAHVGNTRLYLMRDREVHALSDDHTMAAELVRAGVITEQEAQSHPYTRILTRSVGPQPSVLVDTLVFDIFTGDRLLLTTNGLTSYVERSSELVDYLSGAFDSVPTALTEYANELGGSDDVTVIVVRTEHDDGRPSVPLGVTRGSAVHFHRLGSLPLFSDLRLAYLQQLVNLATEQIFVAGEEVLAEGAVCPGLFVVLDGSFSVVKTGTAIGELKAGDSVGEATLLNERPCRAALRAEAGGALLLLEREKFQELTRRLPRLGVILLDRIAQKTSSAYDRAQTQLSESSPQLVAATMRPSDLI